MDNMENEHINKEREDKLRNINKDNAKYDDCGNRITSRQWTTGADGNETYVEKDKYGNILNDKKTDKDKKEFTTSNKKIGKKKDKNKKSDTEKENKNKQGKTKKEEKRDRGKRKKEKQKKAKNTALAVINTSTAIKVAIVFMATHLVFTLIVGIITVFMMMAVLTAIGETTGEYSEDYTASANISNGTGTIPYIDGKYKVNMPIKESTSMTSKYGLRYVKDLGMNFHNGVDFGVQRTSPGTDVYSALPGTVVKVVRWSNPPSSIGVGGNRKLEGEASKGQYVVIEHNVEDFKIYTIYMHLYRINVDVGDSVGNNDVIAIAGNTGASTGPHLHFEIRSKSQSGQTLNPEKYIYYGN